MKNKVKDRKAKPKAPKTGPAATPDISIKQAVGLRQLTRLIFTDLFRDEKERLSNEFARLAAEIKKLEVLKDDISKLSKRLDKQESVALTVILGTVIAAYFIITSMAQSTAVTLQTFAVQNQAEIYRDINDTLRQIRESKTVESQSLDARLDIIENRLSHIEGARDVQTTPQAPKKQ